MKFSLCFIKIILVKMQCLKETSRKTDSLEGSLTLSKREGHYEELLQTYLHPKEGSLLVINT